jgi:hypothetical protein
VAVGSITAVETLRRKWRRAGIGIDRCRGERLRLLKEQLQNALLQIEDIKRKNKKLEERLRVVEVGSEQEGVKCLVLGDSIIRNVGTEHGNMMVECFPGIRTEQQHRVVENGNLGNLDTVVIHIGTNDLRRTVNLDYVMGDVHALVKTEKLNFQNPD